LKDTFLNNYKYSLVIIIYRVYVPLVTRMNQKGEKREDGAYMNDAFQGGFVSRDIETATWPRS